MIDLTAAARAALGKEYWIEDLITATADFRLGAGCKAVIDSRKVEDEQLHVMLNLLAKVFTSPEPEWMTWLKARE